MFFKRLFLAFGKCGGELQHLLDGIVAIVVGVVDTLLPDIHPGVGFHESRALRISAQARGIGRISPPSQYERQPNLGSAEAIAFGIAYDEIPHPVDGILIEKTAEQLRLVSPFTKGVRIGIEHVRAEVIVEQIPDTLDKIASFIDSRMNQKAE